MIAILAAALLAASPQHDTVFTTDGGRVVGTVIEESSQGVAVQLGDGTFRRIPRREVSRIEYSDGTVRRPTEKTPHAAPPVPPPPSYTPPPSYAPPARPPAYPPPAYAPAPAEHGLSPAAGWLSFGMGGLGMSGRAESGIGMHRVFGGQMNLSLEGGLRLTPHLGIGLYLDGGYGNPGADVRDYCAANALDCGASTTRAGVLLRYTFEPFARTTPWLSVGTGGTSGEVTASGSETIAHYSGWEMLRLRGGVDFRSSRVFGFGFYAGIGIAEYSRYEDSITAPQSLSGSTHTTYEAGVRLILFP